ncbi:unnamed protein product, partial [Didymodactylos carnosus]
SKKQILCIVLFLGLISLIIVYVSNPISFTSFPSLNTETETNSCTIVTYKQLDEWFHSTNNNKSRKTITKIIHQSWKTEILRGKQALWSKTWCEQYPKWHYRLWTDVDNDQFVKDKFPWFYLTYQELYPTILKADSVRYLYMLYYGGMYIDLDYESVKSLEHIIFDKQLVFALLNYNFDSLNSIPNSWFASKPKHSLWSYVIFRIMLKWTKIDSEKTGFWNGKAEFYTGPQALFEGLLFYMQYIEQTSDNFNNRLIHSNENRTMSIGDITFLPPNFLNAYDWMTGIGQDYCSSEKYSFNPTKCKELLKPIYGITYWAHSYGHGHENDTNYLRH